MYCVRCDNGKELSIWRRHELVNWFIDRNLEYLEELSAGYESKK